MNTVHRAAFFSVAVMLLCAAVDSLTGQSTTSLRGTVTDPSNAAIPEVVLTLRNAGTGFRRQAVSAHDGSYQFLQTPPGTYELVAEKPGFAKLSRTEVQLLVNTPATLDLPMTIGAAAEAINVSAETTEINTVDASIGNAFSERQVSQLPLETRNVVELLSLQPGVTPTGEVLGARRDQNNITLDGADVNNNQNSGLVAQATGTGTGGYQGSNANGSQVNSGFNAVLPIPLDSVQEFRVTVAGDGANEGRSSGGQVVLVTKSGTNQFTALFTNTIAIPSPRPTRGSTIRPACRCSRWCAISSAARSAARSSATALSTSSITSSAPMPAAYRNLAPCPPIRSAKAFSHFNWRMDPPRPSRPGSETGGSATHRRELSHAQGPESVSIGQRSRLWPGRRAELQRLPLQCAQPSRRPRPGRQARFPSRFRRQTHALNPRHAGGQYRRSGAGAVSRTGPASTLRDNSKGLSAQYTAILRPNLINVFTFGYTRFGQATSGVTGPVLFQNPLDSLQNPYARPFGQRLPTFNPTDDLTWTKGKHTITAGFNLRFIHNNTAPIRPRSLTMDTALPS